jgi:hypothetical protein
MDLLRKIVVRSETELASRTSQTAHLQVGTILVCVRIVAIDLQGILQGRKLASCLVVALTKRKAT